LTAAALYTPFSAENQTECEDRLVDTYGPEMAEAIRVGRATKATKPARIGESMAEMARIEGWRVAGFTAGKPVDPADPKAHLALIARLWGRDCAPGAYAGLPDLYMAHPDFIARFERIAPRYSTWLTHAMKDHAAQG
jgi:MerR family transcriptional regulator, thiopeptide resistance regulator